MKILIASILGSLLTLAATSAVAPKPEMIHPRIADYGGIVQIPGAVEPPRAGAKVVFDITSESPAEKPHKGLEVVARYINLTAGAGVPVEGLKLTAILHGGAAKAVLDDAAFQTVTKVEHNPNLELIRRLQANGVEVLVCGQALSRQGYPIDGVVKNVPIAVSALSANVNRQLDGYVPVAIH
jgi:uncharacterized protein